MQRSAILFVLIIIIWGCEDALPSMLEPASSSGTDSSAPATPTTDDPAVSSSDESPPEEQGHVLSGSASFGTDPFGAANLAPSVPGGASWSSESWGNGRSRTLSAVSTDPQDSMLQMRGHGSLEIHGNGVASVSGRAPRLYVQRPDQKPIWENVEVTYYAKVISQDNPPSHAGFKLGARSWHGTQPWDECNGKTYYGILRFDGHATSVKELKHGTYAGERGEQLWDSVPMEKWIGVKLVLRNRADGSVSLKTYRDMTQGRDGGDWELVADHVDGGRWATSKAPSGCGYDSSHVIRGKAPAVFARFDGVGRIDIREFSVREIESDYDPELFADVDPDSVHATSIAWVKATGLTLGCNPPENTRFCPDDPVTREQMATFLARFLELPPSQADAFTDDDGSVHEQNIDAIAVEGITRGCNPPDNTRFCPRQEVTREQMAAFLTRALSLGPADGDYFDDDAGSIFEDAINRMATAGLAAGCGTNRFCPSRAVTRAQMATFLYRAR